MTANGASAKKMKRKEYEKHLHNLQVELCRLQDWVKAEGARRRHDQSDHRAG